MSTPNALWHEAHPSRIHDPLRICSHPVVKRTEKFLYITAHCGPLPGKQTTRIRHDELAAGVGVDTTIFDRDERGQFAARAWFFEGPVPTNPIRPPGWLRERRKWQEDERTRARWAAEGRDARPPYYTPPVVRPTAKPADLAALGLKKLPDAAGLKRAWRQTAKRVHPDAGGKPADFIAAQAAYERLLVVVAACAEVHG